MALRDWNLTTLAEQDQNNPGVQRFTSYLTVAANDAIALGLSEQVARNHNINWLRTFVEVETNERARMQRLLGSAGIEAGATARRNFNGV